MRTIRQVAITLTCIVLPMVGCGTDSNPDSTSNGGTAGMPPGAGKSGNGASTNGGSSSATGGSANGAGKGGTGGDTGGTGGGTSGGKSNGGSSAAMTGGFSGATSPGGASGSSATGGTDNGGTSNAGTAGSGTSGSAGTAGAAPVGKPVVYIGGSGSNNYPFTTYDFDPDTGELTSKGTTNLGPGPSYIALAPSKKFLVVTNEQDDSSGGLTSATIAADGTLTKLNHVSGNDGGFTYVTVHPSGYALAASYNGGSLSSFPVAADGTLSDEADVMDFGAMAQTHCAAVTSDGMHLLVPNKGNDEVAQLLFDDGMLSANTPPRVTAEDGAGPRHIAIHPNGKLAFVINELDSTMTPYQLATNGTLTAGTPVSTLPDDFNGQNTGAHVEVSPDGKFVYGSNRGHNSIVVFSADQTTGALTFVQHQSSGGTTPRDFDMDPYGRFIVVANQGNSKVAAFSIGDDGKLEPLGEAIGGPSGCSAVQIAYIP